MKTWIPFLTAALLLSACEQNPLKGVSDKFESGRDPNLGKVEAPRAPNKNSLMIDAPPSLQGRVGSAFEFVIAGRVLIPNLNFEIGIENLADFPGATYDPATGIFNWTPDSSVLGGAAAMDKILRVTLTTVPNESYREISRETKDIIFNISGRYLKPLINSVKAQNPNVLIVGQSYSYNFEMEDLDAVDAKDVSFYMTNCQGSTSYESIAHVVGLDTISKMGGGKYQGKFNLDLRYAKNLRERSYCFAAVAVSRLGVMSEPYKVDVRIAPEIGFTDDSIRGPVVIKLGSVAYVNFSIFDPTGNGVVKLQSQDDVAAILPGSSLKCAEDSKSRAILECNAIIDTTQAAEKDYSFAVNVENVLGVQSKAKKHVFSFIVKVNP